MPTAQNHRYHEVLREYWENLRGDRPFPNENEIDPDELTEIWPSCFLISLDDVVKRLGYRYSYLGKDLIEAYGEDGNNPDVVLRLLSTQSVPMVKRFDEVIHGEKPVTDVGEFVNTKHMHIRYRTVMLPLGYQGQVSHIIGCMRWKAY